MPPLVILTIIWLAGPVGQLLRAPPWDSKFPVAATTGAYLVPLLGLVGAWGTCRRRAYGQWAATALAVVSVSVTLMQAIRAGTIVPGVALWAVGMPLLVLYTVHGAHRAWYRRSPQSSVAGRQ